MRLSLLSCLEVEVWCVQDLSSPVFHHGDSEGDAPGGVGGSRN